MKTQLTILFSCLILFLKAQNLVPNPSFETFTSCPIGYSEIYRTTTWFAVMETPDYFNTCSTYPISSIPLNLFGNIQPSSGNAYAGFGGSCGNFPEGMGAQLLSPLSVGTKYYVSFKVCLGILGNINQACALNKIGALFSTNKFDYIANPVALCNCSQVYTNLVINNASSWTTISGSFTADSAYQYINIGRFFTNAATTFSQITGGSEKCSYYFVDDVCVSSDSLYTQTWNPYVSIERISKNTHLRCSPNPFFGSLELNSDLPFETHFNMFDMMGRRVLRLKFLNSYSISASDVVPGFYYYEFSNQEGVLLSNGKLFKE